MAAVYFVSEEKGRSTSLNTISYDVVKVNRSSYLKAFYHIKRTTVHRV